MLEPGREAHHPVADAELGALLRGETLMRRGRRMRHQALGVAEIVGDLCELERIEDAERGCLAALQADAGLREQTSHILHVGLHLREAYRGLGIGSEMLAYADIWARERGFKKLEASIFTTNKRSLDLFIKAGFVEEGIRRQSVRVGKEYIGEVLMGKVLD